ncbi:MAG: Asp23/Gls24 family envelope stress response protein [Mycobacteriales bacterium]
MAQNPDPSSAARPSSVARTEDSALDSSHGRTSIADAVVQKIAGIATREVSGVHNLGTGSARAFGALRERIPGSGGPAITQGVAVEVGEKQAAIDLDIVVEYGVGIAQLAANIRQNVINTVERMTGLSVIEVNIAVDDVHLPGDTEEPEQPSRVE